MELNNWFDVVTRLAAVLACIHIAGALLVRAIWGMDVWNERTRDVWFRDLTSSSIVIIAAGGNILGFDYSEITGVLLLATVLVMHRVVFKVYDDERVNTRERRPS